MIAHSHIVLTLSFDESSEIINATPFAFEPLHLLDEDGRALLVAVVKGTFSVDVAGRCTTAEEQIPVNVAGESFGDPKTTSYGYEPELAFIKLALPTTIAV